MADSEKTDNPDEFITTGQAAEILGVDHKTVRLWCDQGGLRHWRSPSGRRSISRQSVEDMQAERDAALAH